MIKTILIIIVSVAIFGLLLFIFVKNNLKKRINFYLDEKNKIDWNYNSFKNFSKSFFEISKTFFEVS